MQMYGGLYGGNFPTKTELPILSLKSARGGGKYSSVFLIIVAINLTKSRQTVSLALVAILQVTFEL